MVGYAKVDWQPGGSELISASLAVTAATDPGTGPNAAGSVAKADLVQLATGLALYRDSNMLGARNYARVACYDKAGRYLGIFRVDPRTNKGIPKATETLYPIAGNGPIVSVSGSDGLPQDWSRQLALATDNVLRRVAKSKEQNTGAGMITPALAPVVAAVIVGGVALAVVGGIAAWRYLDPELRRDVAQLDAAASAFSQRLATQRDTGTMPPPSPLETATAKRVETLSRDESRRAMMIGGAVVGGIVVAGGIALAVREAMK